MRLAGIANGALLSVAGLALFVACHGKASAPAADLPGHTVVYGGDVTFGRRINNALFDAAARGRIFGDVKPLLAKADLVIVNGEGVIAAGGMFTDKDEPRPYMYRAHPRMIEVLKDAGIDVVTVGNNHSGDYGRDALVEMLDRLTLAGIDYTGGGHDLADARRPAYRRVGDTVIAVVGADLTNTAVFAATHTLPGSLYFDAFKTSKNEDLIVRELSSVLEEARKHAHVVLLTPHWGDCWVDAPTPGLRKLAARLIRAGYDGIMGHSSHWLHGAELVDGKPVLYDAGNLVIDYGGGDDAHRDLLYELTVNRAGVARVTAHPLWLEMNQATLAEGKKRDDILARFAKRSAKLGTKVEVRDGVAAFDCDPGDVAGPPGAPAPPERPKPAAVRTAPSGIVLDALPEGATPVDVEYEGGVHLVGFELVVPEIKAPKGGQFVVLYWTSDAPVTADLEVHVEARGLDEKSREIRPTTANHVPGDWILPAREWPPKKIIADWTLLRLSFVPEGEVEFLAGLRSGGLLEPKRASVTLVDDRLVPLGRAVYKEGARPMFEYLEERAARSGKQR